MSTRAALLTFLGCLALPALAAELVTSQPSLTPSRSAGVMPVDEAFAFNSVLEADGDILLTWTMPPAYYLYRKSLRLEHAGADLTPQLELPEAQLVTDEFFGESAVYFDKVIARLPASAVKAPPGTELEFQLTYQGCLQDIYCYPPAHTHFSVTRVE